MSVIPILAFAIFAAGVTWGERGARRCAIDYPHDGQCGLVVMEGAAFGVVGAAIIVVVGLVFVIRSALKQHTGGK
jgi:hypothetical protein